MNKLSIHCTKFKDRIKEQQLAEKRGWCLGNYGKDENGWYAIFHRKINMKKQTKEVRK